jgi:hypothetical protein
MQIRPIDSVITTVDPTAHKDRDQPQKRQPPRKKDKVSDGTVYKPNGELDEGQPPQVDVLV